MQNVHSKEGSCDATLYLKGRPPFFVQSFSQINPPQIYFGFHMRVMQLCTAQFPASEAQHHKNTVQSVDCGQSYNFLFKQCGVWCRGMLLGTVLCKAEIIKAIISFSTVWGSLSNLCSHKVKKERQREIKKEKPEFLRRYPAKQP